MPAYIPLGKSKTTVVTNKQRKESPGEICVGKNGYIQFADYKIEPIAGLEQGPMDGPKAIVLHRTEGPNLSSALNSAKSSHEGTHFYIDKDGTVTQAASLLKYTAHVGQKIASRAKIEGVPELDNSQSKADVERQMLEIDQRKKEIAKVQSLGSLSKINQYERTKSYPARYPISQESVGIETVAQKFGPDRGATWDPLTSEQAAAISKLVGILKTAYGLTDKDIYQHDWISFKADYEGKGLYPHTEHDGYKYPFN